MFLLWCTAKSFTISSFCTCVAFPICLIVHFDAIKKKLYVRTDEIEKQKMENFLFIFHSEKLFKEIKFSSCSLIVNRMYVCFVKLRRFVCEKLKLSYVAFFFCLVGISIFVLQQKGSRKHCRMMKIFEKKVFQYG